MFQNKNNLLSSSFLFYHILLYPNLFYVSPILFQFVQPISFYPLNPTLFTPWSISSLPLSLSPWLFLAPFFSSILSKISPQTRPITSRRVIESRIFFLFSFVLFLQFIVYSRKICFQNLAVYKLLASGIPYFFFCLQKGRRGVCLLAQLNSILLQESLILSFPLVRFSFISQVKTIFLGTFSSKV